MSVTDDVIDRFRTVFSIDLRALAAFRVGIALLILANLFILGFDLRDFYTDQGIMPRKLWATVTDRWHWSLHAASGQAWFQVLLLVISALIAFLLAVGYRTRLMSVLTWILLVSLVNRNHFILQAGDQLLIGLTFWSMFLPLNARYSVDAALDERLDSNPDSPSPMQTGSRENQYFSVATVAVILQVLYLYFFTALLKTDDTWRVSFDAAFIAVSLEHFAKPLAVFMRDFPALLSVATGYVLLVEFIAPLLALSPFFHVRLRILAVLTLYSLHVAFAMMLHIGLFPYIDFVALLLLVPAVAWERLDRYRQSEQRQAIRIYYDQDCGFCKKTTLLFREFFLNRQVSISPAQEDPEMGKILKRENSWIVMDHSGHKHLHWHAVEFVIRQCWWLKPLAWLMRIPALMHVGNRLYKRIGDNRYALSTLTARFLPYRKMNIGTTFIGQCAAAFFIYAVTMTNIATVKPWGIRSPETVASAVKLARLDQRWGMFAPKPLMYSVYPVAVGTLRNDQLVDLFNNVEQPPSWTPPENGYAVFPGYRWRKVMERVDGNTAGVRGAYGHFLCGRWNHPSRPQELQLATLEIYSIRRRTNTAGQPKKVSKHRLWRHWCYPEFAPDA